MSNVIVFRPPPDPTNPVPLPDNVATTWEGVMEKLSEPSRGGRRILEFDDTNQNCVIPPGDSAYDMRDVSWAGLGPLTGRPRSKVVIADGAQFRNLRMIGGQITIINRATTISPVSDFGTPPNSISQVQIGMRDDCGSTHIVNQGTRPLFEVGTNRVFFFLENCLFGVTILGDVSTSPLIHVSGANNQLTLNLFGQTNLGENVVHAEGNAQVLIGAFGLGAQVAARQETITNPDHNPSGSGVLRISGPGRIQRQIFPPLTQPAVSESGQLANLGLPNALIRCDGRMSTVLSLPRIVGEFTVVPGNGALYTGGQELIFSEVMGGSRLSVKPAPGDTIDGREVRVKIGRRGSRTFVSDGESNWITTAMFPGRPLPANQGGPNFDVVKARKSRRRSHAR
jgi:hypothetical protein